MISMDIFMELVLYSCNNLCELFIVGGDTVSDSTYEGAKFLPTPEKFEAGLQNYAGIIGSGAAVDYISSIGLSNIEEHEKQINAIITKGIKDLPGLKIVSLQEPARRGGIHGRASKMRRCA